MRLEVDPDLCIGSGMCVMTAPELFEQASEDGRAVVLDEHPSGERLERARRAVDHCPAGALALRDSEEP